MTRFQLFTASPEALAVLIQSLEEGHTLPYCKERPECIQSYEAMQTPSKADCRACLVDYLNQIREVTPT